MSTPRERFEAYLRAQAEGCTTEDAKMMGWAYRGHMRGMMERLFNDGLGDLTVSDALAVITLGEYMQPADPEERLRRGLAGIEGMKGKRDVDD